MEARAFDLQGFCAHLNASAKERNALRQDLVRGLKDWHYSVYGYDRYGAETAFLLSERMGVPRIYGFAMLRILHDRRISRHTKLGAAEHALDIAEYGDDLGLPAGLFEGLQFAASCGRLPTPDLRYALVLTAGEERPFEDLDKEIAIAFLRFLVHREDMPVEERALWGHSLLGRHHDEAGAVELINLVLGTKTLPVDIRRELCWAWVNRRQPRLDVPIPPALGDSRSQFVADHMPFWIAHVRSWPSLAMIRLGLVWLARLGEDPLSLARDYIGSTSGFAEQHRVAVADIIAEHHAGMSEHDVKALVERGIGMTGSGPTRRKFYNLGSHLFGPEYLERATHDAAGTVRQWAARQLQKQT